MKTWILHKMVGHGNTACYKIATNLKKMIVKIESSVSWNKIVKCIDFRLITN